MKASSVLGKKIVAVQQRRVHREDTGQYSGYEIIWIELDDGTLIQFDVAELGDRYAVMGDTRKNGKQIG